MSHVLRTLLLGKEGHWPRQTETQAVETMQALAQIIMEKKSMYCMTCLTNLFTQRFDYSHKTQVTSHIM